ncbi:copper fist DNA binding domain-containing protein, partial [Choanephora cucurbitarum]
MVIWMDGIRYACASCIRGHRVKQCQHQDRPLMVLAKRGRQITQCSHCRDLRKSMNSHIKCTCATHSKSSIKLTLENKI